jgi:hypothetical protein
MMILFRTSFLRPPKNRKNSDFSVFSGFSKPTILVISGFHRPVFDTPLMLDYSK